MRPCAPRPRRAIALLCDILDEVLEVGICEDVALENARYFIPRTPNDAFRALQRDQCLVRNKLRQVIFVERGIGLSFALALLLLGGCTMGPDYVRPEIETPDTWTAPVATDSAVANLPWFELFADPVLVDMIHITLRENRDSSKYEVWFYTYPLGLPLDLLADGMAEFLEILHRQLRFDEMHVVAHSMGGLVSRGGLNRCQQAGACSYLRTYTTISTPWSVTPTRCCCVTMSWRTA